MSNEKKYLDYEGLQYLWSKISMEDYPNNETLIAILNAIDETKANKEEIPLKVSQLENDSKFATEEQVQDLYNRLNSNATLGFYCVEDVTIVLNGVSTTYPANSNVEIKLLDTDTFEIIPTSDYSILTLNAFPGALGTYYSWLEGVKQFSNILFDMNPEDMYTKWNQGNQGAYQVQYAQYSNCIFWSDNPYINDVTKRTNYTLYNSAQLPLCYSSIPDNTFKAFYLALGVVNDPNWSNDAYKESFAKATWATQVFSYYGARVIGTPEHFSITLPKDCRGLMFYARNAEAAGTFDATNVTNFGAKSGSWRDAFGYCSSLRRLYIENLKVNLNISWSPIDYDSIYYIISEAANTNKITISVSPYTYYLLSEADFALAASKNITIELLTTNCADDKRFSTVAYKTGDGEFTGDVIAGGNGGEAPVSLKSVANDIVNIQTSLESNYATKEYIDIRIPAWTEEDEGKVLKIINGIPAWGDLTIIFFIDEDSYEALPGMTWKEWCESSYNSGFWTIDESTEVVCDSDYYITFDNTYVKPTDFIKPNTDYETLFNNTTIV